MCLHLSDLQNTEFFPRVGRRNRSFREVDIVVTVAIVTFLECPDTGHTGLHLILTATSEVNFIYAHFPDGKSEAHGTLLHSFYHLLTLHFS